MLGRGTRPGQVVGPGGTEDLGQSGTKGANVQEKASMVQPSCP